MRLGKKGTLSPRHIGPYKICKRIGDIAYEIEILHELVSVHLVFHVSMLKKYIRDLLFIIQTEDIGIKDNVRPPK